MSQPMIHFIDVRGVHHVKGDIVLEDYDPETGPMREQICSLEDIDAMALFIMDQCPNGWEIKDGKVIAL